MNKLDKIKVKKLIHSIGLKYHMTDETIKNIVESQWEFAHQKMISMNWDDIHTEEDLSKAKTNFLFKYLGRIYVSMIQINRLNKRREDERNGEHDTGRCIGSDSKLSNNPDGEENNHIPEQ